MREERLEASVTFDERHGYVASAPELRSAVVALSLGGLRRKIEALLLPAEVEIVLQLDGLAAAHPELVIAIMNAGRVERLGGVEAGRRHRACGRGPAGGGGGRAAHDATRELLRVRP